MCQHPGQLAGACWGVGPALAECPHLLGLGQHPEAATMGCQAPAAHSWAVICAPVSPALPHHPLCKLLVKERSRRRRAHLLPHEPVPAACSRSACGTCGSRSPQSWGRHPGSRPGWRCRRAGRTWSRPRAPAPPATWRPPSPCPHCCPPPWAGAAGQLAASGFGRLSAPRAAVHLYAARSARQRHVAPPSVPAPAQPRR